MGGGSVVSGAPLHFKSKKPSFYRLSVLRSYLEDQTMGGGNVASGGPIVDTKSKEYRRDEAFLLC